MKFSFSYPLIVLFISLLNVVFGQAPNLGIPKIHHYSKKEYSAGTQNWDIAQARNGLVYFANNEGLLEYNGKNWQLFPLANRTIVRSVAIDEKDRIFVGGQGEFGFFSYSAQGLPIYESLLPLVPEASRNFSDVWDILIKGDETFFRTSKYLFVYSDGAIKSYSTGTPLSFLGQAGDRILLQDEYFQFFEFIDNHFEILKFKTQIASIVTSFIPLDDGKILISTLKDGLFHFNGKSLTPWPIPAESFLKESRIYSATQLENGHFAFGTSRDGLAILNQEGKIIHHFSRQEGLQNNNVLSVLLDQSNNLWLGFDNGIDHIEIATPFNNIFPDAELQGTAYSACIFEEKIYFGTSNGLYRRDWQSYYDPLINMPYQLVTQTSGQVWSLEEIKGQLFLGHHEGAFQLEQSSANAIDPKSTWTFKSLSPDHLLSGRYDGLAILEKNGNKWEAGKALEGLVESCRILEIDEDNRIWMSHPYRGVYQINISEDQKELTYQLYGEEQGLHSDLFNYIFKIQGKIVVGTEQGCYQYNPNSNLFEPHVYLNKNLGKNVWVKKLQEDQQGNIWFAVNDDVGVLWIKDAGFEKNISKEIYPQLKEKLVGGFEFIYPYDEQNIFFGTEKGFLHFNPVQYTNVDTSIKVLISEVQITGTIDSLLWSGRNEELQTQEAIVLPSQSNNLRFGFAAPVFHQVAGVQYSYRLKGMEEEWSHWTEKPEKEYTNLPAQSYEFQLRGRNSFGVISEIKQFNFKIRPPWYLSKLAKGIYFLLFLGLLAALIFYQQKRFDQEKEVLRNQQKQKEEEQNLKIQQSEQAINNLQNEKLASEVQHKNQELASATMHLVQKKEMLQKIQLELRKVIGQPINSDTVKSDIKKIIRLLNSDQQIDNDWQDFEKHFDQVHSDFFKRLREAYPHLTPNDYRLAAYLRMNLTSKEMAQLMNISLRGVEASRYRLRKKLNLTPETHLIDFMMGV